MLIKESQACGPDSATMEQRALVMAVATVTERIQRLPKDDRDEVFELVKELRNATTREEVESLVAAFLEVLEQRPIAANRISLVSNGDRHEDLKKWTDYVSNQIRAARTEAGLTQEQLAELSGLPQSHISRLEGGKHSPSRMTLEKIAAALQMPLSNFDPSA